jgi:hypothetical protein
MDEKCETCTFTCVCRNCTKMGKTCSTDFCNPVTDDTCLEPEDSYQAMLDLEDGYHVARTGTERYY